MTNLYDVIVRPVITERSMATTEAKKYTFEVLPGANKAEVKKAVEQIFGVKVASVNTINVHPKAKRLGAARRPDQGLEESYRAADRGLQGHRILRRHGVRRVTKNGDSHL